VSSQSPLFHRTVRNAVEHFDEYLEHWARTTRYNSIIHTGITPPVVGIDINDHHRIIDPTTGNFIVMGKIANLPEMMEEIARIDASVGRWYQVRRWFLWRLGRPAENLV
jgi:hypothetical protein